MFPAEYLPRLDDTTTPDVIYIGFARVGATTSLPMWAIQKVSIASGVIVTLADGNWNFDNIWDNRATTQQYR